ncbi:MAG: succinate-semialdehyde dehydrogenase (NADP(+)) [Candidatus Rokuibacteriota bacterium]|nr:MAG: succinate-semialdehyde dehydrogenase (NADP(+)) [Candidatus Rokubacteria bacterium]PYM64525.1 MAG: succinate-semialdehyde dehydrogenase (NADP(+)) [Candidatus Rokubacteria bacterium]PYN69106.1 MAG: succinate-semialdehyde dehydrogenase (NADP(+)) [Candidatus Rokubacteria bacterium]
MADVERMYIDGEWTLAEGGATFDVVNPADRTVVARVTNGAVPDVQRAVRAAHRAFTDWSVLAPKDRGRFLLGIQELMEERRDELARLVTLENGKPFEEAKKEVQFSLGYFGWFAEEARRMTGEWIPSPQPGKRYWVLRQPVGPVAAVTPWNFPATMVTRKIAPALAAGCTVVLKPASATPLTALAIAKIAEDTGLPRGVFNVLTTNRSGLVGAELLTHPLIRKIGFTGSTDVGKGIMEAAARQIKRLSFELGGNAPFIVFEDADFKAALDGAVAMKFLRVAGQSCICANRIYVQRSIADRFVPAFVDAVKGLKVASGFEPAAQIGPLINEETRAKVHALVEDAVTRGARLVTGGHYLTGERYATGFFYAPAVLLDVTDDMPIAQEEIFGPAAPILVFDTEEEVIRRANATKFGLAAYFYTRDMTRLVRVAERLEYGLVGANDAAGYTHEIPFGGFKESGLGREGGHEGIEEYTEVKSVVVNLG